MYTSLSTVEEVHIRMLLSPRLTRDLQHILPTAAMQTMPQLESRIMKEGS